ncbi:E3 SUMO-protein ligase NSE2-like [Halyomorpha halys]|uniref:E3 SUMO-protein ligase NSE2-like n=1 Tax=Halyomorpha halys TaxID=286706 RepID=UPI0034D2C37E
MEEVRKLLDESSKRLNNIADLIFENFNDEIATAELSKLYDISNEMDSVNHQAKIQQTALTNCKSTLSQVEEPWNCNIQQVFAENLEKENDKKSKNKDEFNKILTKYVKRKKNQDDELDVVEEAHTAIDPWTKQPILQPVQSKNCKHTYDKRSIACITRNRNQFKCPYVGCQNIVTQEDLIDLD